MAKVVVRMATRGDPIFTGRFTISSKKFDVRSSGIEDRSRDRAIRSSAGDLKSDGDSKRGFRD